MVAIEKKVFGTEEPDAFRARVFDGFGIGGLLLLKGEQTGKNLELNFIGAALCALGLTFLWSTRSKE